MTHAIDSSKTTISPVAPFPPVFPASDQASLSNDSANHVISSSYTRKVSVTVNIPGKLPNTVYTLPVHLIRAIIGLADRSSQKELFAICQKFMIAEREYQQDKHAFSSNGTTLTLHGGRLYVEGNNSVGQRAAEPEGKASEEEVTGPRLIRLPPVLHVWHGVDRWFAKTAWGLYACGQNKFSELGVSGAGSTPARVPIVNRIGTPSQATITSIPTSSGPAVDVLDIIVLSRRTLFRTAACWFACGLNICGRLGVGHVSRIVEAPTPVLGSGRVTRWGFGDTMFAWTNTRLLSCGDNRHGQCGVGSTEGTITTLTPVALPEDVKGRVDQVVFDDFGTFIQCGRRCFGCGENTGRLGVESDDEDVRTPIELPVPVDQIITCGDLTVIRSGDTLLGCGENTNHWIRPDDVESFPAPTRLALHGPVVKVVIVDPHVFFQLEGGGWFGRDEEEEDDEEEEAGWMPVVDDDYADELTNMEVDDDVMILPAPIG